VGSLHDMTNDRESREQGKIIRGEAKTIDSTAKKVLLADGQSVPYDYVSVCVCVCVRKRERERSRLAASSPEGFHSISFSHSALPPCISFPPSHPDQT
jgi:hypothetical protein